MMYESAKKQLAWTLKVLKTEIKERDDMCRTYSRLMEKRPVQKQQ